MEAKEMLKRLQASGYGEFPNGQLRTLQRRVRVWRMRIVQQLVYGHTEQEPKSGTTASWHVIAKKTRLESWLAADSPDLGEYSRWDEHEFS
jgi:hypothetical protein